MKSPLRAAARRPTGVRARTLVWLRFMMLLLISRLLLRLAGQAVAWRGRRIILCRARHARSSQLPRLRRRLP